VRQAASSSRRHADTCVAALDRASAASTMRSCVSSLRLLGVRLIGWL